MSRRPPQAPPIKFLDEVGYMNDHEFAGNLIAPDEPLKRRLEACRVFLRFHEVIDANESYALLKRLESK